MSDSAIPLSSELLIAAESVPPSMRGGYRDMLIRWRDEARELEADNLRKTAALERIAAGIEEPAIQGGGAADYGWTEAKALKEVARAALAGEGDSGPETAD